MRPARLVRQRGSVAPMFAVFALAWLGFLAMTLDLARAFNRRAELQAAVDGAALAGAKSLDGTAAGVAAAMNQARTRWQQLGYRYVPVTLPAEAIVFAGTPDAAEGAWKTQAQAASTPAGLHFIRVDGVAYKAAGDVPLAEIQTTFIRLLAPSLTTLTLPARAVAGRYGAASKAILLYR